MTANRAGTEIAIALNPAYEIEVLSMKGQQLRIVRRLDGLRVPTQTERDLARNEVLAPFRIFNDDALLALVLRDVPEPETLPAVQGLVIAASGELWVQRHIARYSAGPSTFDVFDARGEFLGEVSLPPGVTVVEVGEDHVLGVRVDENDVPFVELYDLVYANGAMSGEWLRRSLNEGRVAEAYTRAVLDAARKAS